MNIRRLGATVATVTALSLATPTFAIQSGGGTAGRTQLETISVDFAGGSLADFVSALRQASDGQAVNILYQPEFAGLQLPPMRLDEVHLYSALRVAARLSEDRPALMPDGREAMWEVEADGGGGGSHIYVISVWADEHEDEHDEYEHEEDEHEEEEHERFTTIQSLAGLISGRHAMDADAVLSSIQIALDMTDEGDADLRFHEDTGLLFARVTSMQEDAMHETVGMLMQSAAARREAHSQSQTSRLLDALGVDSAEDAMRRLNAAEAALDEATQMERRVREVQADFEAEMRGQQRMTAQLDEEVSELRARLRQAEEIVQEQQHQRRELEVRLERMRAERDTLRAELEAMKERVRPRE